MTRAFGRVGAAEHDPLVVGDRRHPRGPLGVARLLGEVHQPALGVLVEVADQEVVALGVGVEALAGLQAHRVEAFQRRFLDALHRHLLAIDGEPLGQPLDGRILGQGGE